MRKISEIFPSVILPVSHADGFIESYLRELSDHMTTHFEFFEIIVVDNASKDETAARVKTTQQDKSNITLYELPKSYDISVATIVGLDHAIGDMTIVLDPFLDPPSVTFSLVEEALNGHDVVYGVAKGSTGLYYLFESMFLYILAKINGLDEKPVLSSARLFSRTMLNFILKSSDRHRILSIAPALSGFATSQIEYERRYAQSDRVRTSWRASAYNAIRLLLSASPRPMRLVTLLSLLIGLLTIVYSCYVVLFWFFANDIAPGWVSISLQISGLFFLISLVLAFISEYLQQILESIERRPLYLVARQSNSEVMTYAHELNVTTEQPEAIDSHHREQHAADA